MTDELVRGAILLGIEDAGPEATPEQIAETILNSIKTALRLEARMERGGKPIPPQSSDAPRQSAIPTPPPAAQESMIVMANEPVNPPDGKRLIVMPDEPEAKQPVQSLDSPEAKKPVIRLSSLKKAPRQKDNWKIEDLLEYLHNNTPESLCVTPQGTTTEISLERNIEAAPPLGAAKLIYTLTGMSHDRPGKDNMPAVVGRFVTHNFFCSDPLDLPIESVLSKLREQARDVFKPRDRVIQSHTPYKPGGSLRIEVDNNGKVIDSSMYPTGETYVMDLTEPERIS